ncbi:MAG: hypothetical protein WCQ41_04740 [Bacillota bacterium]
MKNKNWFWGIFFILSAVSVIAIQTGSFAQIGIQSMLLGAFLVAIIIASLVRVNFFGIFFPIAFLYMILWQPLNIMYVNYWFVALSALLVSIGFSIIFGKSHRSWSKCGSGSEYNKSGFNKTIEDIDDNNPSVEVKFGAASKYLHANALKSGRFSASFGELEIFFDEVTLDPEGAAIVVECSFGKLTLNIPRSWRIIDNTSVSLGEMINNSRPADIAEDAPQLTISGHVSLGGIEIRRV